MRNSYLKDFQSTLRMRFADDREGMSMSEWIAKNTRLRSKPFSFKGYEFQRAIVDDMHPNLTCLKCSQIGLTEVQLRKFAAFLARNIGVSAIFSLPDDVMFKRVSQTRWQPILEDPVFNLGEAKPIRSMGISQINNSFGYMVGNKEGDATSINADALFHDEVDLSDQEMLALFQSRLQGSKHRITQGFSTPTFEGFGIDASWKTSDQHEYLTRCTKCNHYNIPEFSPRFISMPGLKVEVERLTDLGEDDLEGVDLAGSHVICENCSTPLDLTDPELRQWVPRFPGRRGRGYRVSPFCTAHLTPGYILEQLIQYKRRDALRRFYNTVLGLPFDDTNARLTEEEIASVMGSEVRPEITDGIVLGIDVGHTCHVVLMRAIDRVAFSWKQVHSENLVDEVRQILDTYRVIAGCIDRNPFTPLSNEIRDISNGLIMPVEYSTSLTAPALHFSKDELDNIAYVRGNRTTMIDTAAQAIRKRRMQIVGYGHQKALITNHLRDMVRIEKEDDTAQWVKQTGQDHYFHALTYAHYALRLRDALDYRAEEERDAWSDGSLTVLMNQRNDLTMKSRRSGNISLGTL